MTKSLSLFCLHRMILPQLEKCRKCPIKLGVIFVEQEDDILNYSKYFKNMPHQTKLMEEGGTEFFAVSHSHAYKHTTHTHTHTHQHTHTHTYTHTYIHPSLSGILSVQVVQRRLKKCFDLSSYLIKPFQRITRYKLFLAVSHKIQVPGCACCTLLCLQMTL